MNAEIFYTIKEKYYGLELSKADRQLIIRMLDEYKYPNNNKKRKIPTNSDNETIEIILEAIEYYFEIPRDEFLLKRRNREYVKCRAIGHYLAKILTKNISLSNIGYLIGGKDHATVKHSIKTVGNEMETSSIYALDIINIHEQIKRIRKQNEIKKIKATTKKRKKYFNKKKKYLKIATKLIKNTNSHETKT